jgi:hypothetical protein
MSWLEPKKIRPQAGEQLKILLEPIRGGTGASLNLSKAGREAQGCDRGGGALRSDDWLWSVIVRMDEPLSWKRVSLRYQHMDYVEDYLRTTSIYLLNVEITKEP